MTPAAVTATARARAAANSRQPQPAAQQPMTTARRPLHHF